MRIGETRVKEESKDGLLSVLMGLVLVAGAVLSLGIAPTELENNFSDVSRPEAAGLAATSSDDISPAVTIAANSIVDESSTLDLQLD